MHKTQPHQRVRILQLEIAVPAEAESPEVRDEISALLTELGTAALEGNILDWRYTGVEREIVASDNPKEGEIFTKRIIDLSSFKRDRDMNAVLNKARELNIANNTAPEAIFEARMVSLQVTDGFQIWCTPKDHPQGWDDVPMKSGAFSKPCAYVASVFWYWENEEIPHLGISTDAYALSLHHGKESFAYHNRPADIAWAKRKIRWLFTQAGVRMPPI